MKSESAQTFYRAEVHQYVLENVAKIGGGDFGAFLKKKPWAIALGIFQELACLSI